MGIQATLRNRGLFRTRVSGRLRRVTAVVRIAAGVVFVLFGVVKFIVPEYELAEFVRFGFPNVVAIVYLVGLLEIVGGLMLVVGLLTRLAAAALALNMAGAVLTAGIYGRRADPSRSCAGAVGGDALPAVGRAGHPRARRPPRRVTIGRRRDAVSLGQTVQAGDHEGLKCGDEAGAPAGREQVLRRVRQFFSSSVDSLTRIASAGVPGVDLHPGPSHACLHPLDHAYAFRL